MNEFENAEIELFKLAEKCWENISELEKQYKTKAWVKSDLEEMILKYKHLSSNREILDGFGADHPNL